MQDHNLVIVKEPVNAKQNNSSYPQTLNLSQVVSENLFGNEGLSKIKTERNIRM